MWRCEHHFYINEKNLDTLHFRGQIPPIFDKLDHISACKFLSTLPEHYYYYYYYDDGAAAPHRGSRKRTSRSYHVHRLSITLSRWLQYWSPCTNHSLGPLPEHDYRYGSNINISRFVSLALNRTRKFVEARKPFWKQWSWSTKNLQKKAPGK